MELFYFNVGGCKLSWLFFSKMKSTSAIALNLRDKMEKGDRLQTDALRGNWMEYSIPRLRSPINSRRFPEISVITNQVSCRFPWKNHFPPFAPVDFRRKPEPVPHTQGPSWARSAREEVRMQGCSDFSLRREFKIVLLLARNCGVNANLCVCTSAAALQNDEKDRQSGVQGCGV